MWHDGTRIFIGRKFREFPPAPLLPFYQRLSLSIASSLAPFLSALVMLLAGFH
jgi:hypothetical protein